VWSLADAGREYERVNQTVEKFISFGDGGSQDTRWQKLVQLSKGLTPMTQRLVNRIQAIEFVEFSDFLGLDGGALSVE